MSKRLLDLFCGAGGVAMGLHRAGFDIVGVDIVPQPRYPFEFILGDALTYPLKGFDAYWASPPCQRFSSMTKMYGKSHVNSHPDLIQAIRFRLEMTGKPYVIENVPSAPLLLPVRLCGTMFGLHSGIFHLRRHRLFECNFDLRPPSVCRHIGLPLSVYGHPGGTSCRDHQKFGQAKDWRIGMGIDWMTNDELAQAIPPAYTEYIGKYLMQEVIHVKDNKAGG